MPVIHLLFAALLLLPGAAAGERPSQAAQTPPPPDAPAPEATSVAMELLASRPLIRVTINGHGPLPFLIGPEDQPSLIDAALAETLKIRVAKGAPDPTVELGFGAGADANPGAVQGPASLKVAVRVADLTPLLPDVGPTARPRGVISLSAWKDYLVTIDYSRWRLSFERGGLPEPNGTDVFALSASRDLRLPLALAERSVDCRVDPLFPGGLLLSMAELGEVPTDGAPRDWGPFATREGVVQVKEARLATTLMLGPYELKTPVVMLADTAAPATVGTQWLRRFAVTYDLTNGRARLERPAVH